LRRSWLSRLWLVLRVGTTAGRVLTPDESLEDLAWAVLTSREFLFNH